jgi:uncharacterized protein (TIGR02231 family)
VAETVQVATQAPVTAVTVFRDGARVVRTGSVPVEAGLTRAVVSGLPASVDTGSVRIGLRGHHVVLVDIEVNRRYSADPLRDETASLSAEVDTRRDAVQALDDEDAATQAALGFTGHLAEAAAGALARAVSFGRISHDDLDQMAGHLTASTAASLARRREISARLRAAKRELAAAEHRLDDVKQRSGSVESVEAVAVIEAVSATEAEIELSYHATEVSWRPLYDLALSGEKLSISYLAEITQRTGEDWPAADLAVSTARRGRHQSLPELSPWYVGRPKPPPLPPMAAAPGRYESATTPAGGAMRPMAAPAQAVRAPMAEPLAAEVGESGAGLVYRISRPLAVPSDGSPHKTSIARLELDASLDHLVVPALAQEAYLRATVTNDSKLLLLPGPARIFHDGQFVGQTTMETVASGEEMELQLGVDDQIRVERELSRRATSKAVIGGSRTIDVSYTITVQNHRNGPAKISVHDHIPVSTDGDVKVRLREARPDPAETTELGELTWNVVLERGKSATISYRFTVEHPGNATLRGI